MGVRGKCGVAGVFGVQDSSYLVYDILKFLQHRAHETAGISSTDREDFYVHKDKGLVKQVFSSKSLDSLLGDIAIGHIRYSTTGEKDMIKNAQPLGVRLFSGDILSIAHNGNIINHEYFRKKLEKEGISFNTSSDTEVIFHLIRRSGRETIEEKIADAVKDLEGSFSLVCMTNDKLLGIRDNYGNRPLWLGSYDGINSKDDVQRAYVLSSEDCGAVNLGVSYEREVFPGEIVSMSDEGTRSHSIDGRKHLSPDDNPSGKERQLQCVFEHLYYSRPDSVIFGRSVAESRIRLGEQLFREVSRKYDSDEDCIINVPDSGNFSAQGYSDASGIPLRSILVRSHYSGRTFNDPDKKMRRSMVKEKLSPIRSMVEGRKVRVIDDTIVRSNTIKEIIELLKNAGADKVYVGIPAPPVRDCCFLGVDIPTRKELVAYDKSPEEIKKEIDADRLDYLSLEGMLDSLGFGYQEVCTSCFTGEQYFDVSSLRVD